MNVAVAEVAAGERLGDQAEIVAAQMARHMLGCGRDLVQLFGGEGEAPSGHLLRDVPSSSSIARSRRARSGSIRRRCRTFETELHPEPAAASRAFSVWA